MRQEVFVSDEAVDLIADDASFRFSKILMSVEIGPEIHVEWTIHISPVDFCPFWWRGGGGEGFIVEVVADDVRDLFED